LHNVLSAVAEQEMTNQAFAAERAIAKDAVLIIPAVHLSVCFIYLCFYFIAFGGKVEAFSSAQDVFSLSFANIAPFYLGFAVPHLLMAYFRGHAYSKLPAGTEFERSPKFRVVASLICGLSVLLAIWGAAYLFVTGLVPMDLWGIGALLLVLLGSNLFANKRPALKRELVGAVVIGLAFLTYSAAKTGQRDRYAPAIEFSSSSACKDKRVLRALGDQFLAVDVKGLRAVIDRHCNTQFVIGYPTKPYFSDWDVVRLRNSLVATIRGADRD
jgi:hypothetical protein